MRAKKNPWRQLLIETKKISGAESFLVQDQKLNKPSFLAQIFSNACSASSSTNSSVLSEKNLSLRLQNFVDWAHKNDHLAQNSSNPIIALTRSIHRYLQIEANLNEDDFLESQVSPTLSISTELLEQVDQYADNLDRNTHLCFCLHAEGLLNDEISVIANIPEEHVELYIKTAKKLIQEHLKKLLEVA